MKKGGVSSRYASVESSPSSADTKQPRRHLLNAMPHQTSSNSSSKALVPARSDRRLQPHPHSLGSMLKRLISAEKTRSNISASDPPPLFPANQNKNHPTTASNNINKKLSAMSRKLLFHKGGGDERKALTEVKSNSRSLAMVLRSERELLAQNKEYEDDISRLRLLLQQKDTEVEKLKDLCLRQREEIKALKDAVLFPDDVVESRGTRMEEVAEEQACELKQARRLIPTLQDQVSSLTNQIQCLADDLAQVKADKLMSRTFFDDYTSSPRMLERDQETAYSLECSTGEVETPNYGSPDEMFLKDLNPCLTPRISKSKSEEYDRTFGCGSLKKDETFQCSRKIKQGISLNSRGRLVSKSSEHHAPTSCANGKQQIYISDEDKIYHKLF